MSIQQAEAILFGLALGDALGAPTEFMPLHGVDGIFAQYGVNGIQEPPTSGLYTDDTQMTLALTEGLLDAGLNAALDLQMQRVAARFIEWANSPENNRAPGMTCMRSIRRLEQGASWNSAGDPNSKGCGTAMRVAGLGYLYQHDEERLRTIAIESSRITHSHPAALAAAVAAAYLVKLALDGVQPSEYLGQVMQFAEGMSDELDYALLRVGHVLGWGSEEQALAHLGEGWVGDEAVALALYCVLRYPNDYVAGIRRAANTQGDSDSIACIVGGILGARCGLDAIPLDWRARCENSADLKDLAQRMALARAALREG